MVITNKLQKRLDRYSKNYVKIIDKDNILYREKGQLVNNVISRNDNNMAKIGQNISSGRKGQIAQELKVFPEDKAARDVVVDKMGKTGYDRVKTRAY